MQVNGAKNIAIVCNPLAGNGKALKLAEKISTRLTSENLRYTLFTDHWPPEFKNFTGVFIVGGDGTLNYFINHYPEIAIPLVVFKGGTGNDFHWMLFGDKNFDEQFELSLKATPRPIDAGKCNDRYFINGIGIGYDGAVAKALMGKKKILGKTSFMITILRKIFFYRSSDYRISSAEHTGRKRRLMVSVYNGRRAGGGFLVSPNSFADDGWLDAILIDRLSPLKRLRYLPVIEKGNHLDLDFIECFKTKKIVVRCGELMDAHLDGEYYSGRRFEIILLPAKFLFIY